MGTTPRQSAAFAAMACLVIAVAVDDCVDAGPQFPAATAVDSEPSQAVHAAELLELDMSNVAAEALLRRLGFRGGIWNLNCGSADGLYSLPEFRGEAAMLSYGMADANGTRHLTQWHVLSGGASVANPRMSTGLRAFKLLNPSNPDEWPTSSTIHAATRCYPQLGTERSAIVPVLTTPED